MDPPPAAAAAAAAAKPPGATTATATATATASKKERGHHHGHGGHGHGHGHGHAPPTALVASDVTDVARLAAFISGGGNVNAVVPFVNGNCVPKTPCKPTCSCADAGFQRTLLHWAVAFGCPLSTLEMLVNADADVLAIDAIGDTPHDLAAAQGASEDTLDVLSLMSSSAPGPASPISPAVHRAAPLVVGGGGAHTDV